MLVLHIDFLILLHLTPSILLIFKDNKHEFRLKTKNRLYGWQPYWV